jgi:hypothetical protein
LISEDASSLGLAGTAQVCPSIGEVVEADKNQASGTIQDQDVFPV